jgi:hypothetical protein
MLAASKCWKRDMMTAVSMLPASPTSSHGSRAVTRSRADASSA